MKKSFLVLLVAALAGCWTFNQSEYPQVQVSAAPSNRPTLAVTGFDAVFTEYVSVGGYQTFYVPGYYGRHHYHPGYYETVSTHTLVPQARTTDAFQKRARDAFEDAGFVVGATTPDWTVEVTFEGPFYDSGDASSEVLWLVCTLFFCDYSAQSWNAKLRIRDNRNGQLVFHREYAQRYETNVFGLIPIFGVASCDKTSPTYMQSWCLGALSDRAVADAAAFLGTVK